MARTNTQLAADTQAEDFSKYDEAAANAVVAPNKIEDAKVPTGDAKEVTKVSEAAQVILDSTATKSVKIRGLLAIGLKRGEVAKLLGIRYQHVRNVEITPIKRVG